MTILTSLYVIINPLFRICMRKFTLDWMKLKRIFVIFFFISDEWKIKTQKKTLIERERSDCIYRCWCDIIKIDTSDQNHIFFPFVTNPKRHKILLFTHCSERIVLQLEKKTISNVRMLFLIAWWFAIGIPINILN